MSNWLVFLIGIIGGIFFGIISARKNYESCQDQLKKLEVDIQAHKDKLAQTEEEIDETEHHLNEISQEVADAKDATSKISSPEEKAAVMMTKARGDVAAEVTEETPFAEKTPLEAPETPAVEVATPEIPEARTAEMTTPEIPETPAAEMTTPEIPETPAVEVATPEFPEAPAAEMTTPEIPEAPAAEVTTPEFPEAGTAEEASGEAVTKAEAPATPVAATASRSDGVIDDGETESIAECPQKLARIKGVGRVYEDRLYKAGIGTFWQVTMSTEEELASIFGLKDFQGVDLAAIQQFARQLAEETGTTGLTWSGREPDDMENLPGIGKTYEGRLYDAGVCTWEKLAALTPEALAAIVKAPKWNQPDYEAWIAYAKEHLAGNA